MAFEIIKTSETSEWYETRETLWLTAGRERVVKDGDPEAAFLFATEGKRIAVEDVERYGLVAKAKKQKDESEPDDGLEGLTVKDLVATASTEGLTGISNLSKAELITVIREGREGGDSDG